MQHTSAEATNRQLHTNTYEVLYTGVLAAWNAMFLLSVSKLHARITHYRGASTRQGHLELLLHALRQTSSLFLKNKKDFTSRLWIPADLAEAFGETSTKKKA